MSFGKLGTFGVFGMRPSTVGVASPTVTRPTVTSPANAATDIGETPTITSSAFSSSDALDTHAVSDWEVASDSGFSTVVASSYDDAANLVSWTVPGGNLLVSTTYYIRVRHGGTSYGDSAWSDAVSFTTAASFAYTWTNSEGASWEAQCTTTGWDDAFRGDVDQLISDLKTAGTWSGYDRILIDTPNEADSLRYLNAPTLTATAVNSPTFTANRGFTGNGSTSYIDTNFAPSTDGVQYTQNSASLAVWVRGVGASGTKCYAGVNDGFSQQSAIFRRADGSSWQAVGPNDTAVLNGTTVSQSATGLLSANRSGASAREMYLNGSSEGSDASASVALPAYNITLLARNSSTTPTLYSDGQISGFAVGRSFTATEQTDNYNAFNTYRTAREAV